MQIEVRLQDLRRHLDYFCFMAAKSSPLDVGSAEWAKIRTVVDEQPPGKLAQLGMMFTSRGWQATATVSQTLDTTLPWFSCTVLQLANVAVVAYGRGLGHIPAMKGYVMGLLMWWGGPQGPIYFEEFKGSRSSEHRLRSISLRTRHPED